MGTANRTGISLRPAWSQLLSDRFKCVTLLAVAILCLGVADRIAVLCGMTVVLTCLASLLARLWYLTSVVWAITDTQIKYTRGIISRNVDYMELYRVIDYQEKQNMIQQIMGIKDIIIVSGDKSHPMLRMYGIKNNLDIIGYINEKVEQTKKERKIYEITNR